VQRPWQDDSLAANGRAIRDNFADWFGQSRVVDATGAPLAVYHGTTQSFDAFDMSFQGTNVRRNPTTRMGFFFTESVTGAQRWAVRQGGMGANILPVHLAIANPKKVSANKFSYFLKTARSGTIDRFVEEAAEAGFDGLCIDYSHALDHGQDDVHESWWVAFSGTQIKSALGNSGLYLKDSRSLSDREAAMALENSHKAKALIATGLSPKARHAPAMA
jgi:hypothetical protein